MNSIARSSLKVQTADSPTTWRLSFRPIVLLLFFAALAQFVGCNSLGNAKLVQELRNENERLLAEFRAERDRREKAEREKAMIETRLAESEKLLARSYNGSFSNRLSSLPQYGDSGYGESLADSANEAWRDPGSSSDGPSAGGGNGTGLRWQGRN